MARIICLGNNTEDTDFRTRQLAQSRALVYHGLLSTLDSVLESNHFQDSGVYHTSVYDIPFGQLVELVNQFDNLIVLDQPKEQWSHPDAYLLSLRLARIVKIPVEYLDPTVADATNFFENLVQTNRSFCIFPFIELLAYSDHSSVCCRSVQPVSKIQDIGNWATSPAYQEIRNKMLAGERLWDHCGTCYQLEDKGILSARQQETVEWANRLNLQSISDLSSISHPAYIEIRASNKCNLQCRMCSPESSHLIDQEYRSLGWRIGPPMRSYDYGFDLVDFTNLKKLYVAGGEPLIMPEFYQFIDRCIAENQVHFEFLINTNGTKLSDKFKKQILYFSNLQFIFSIDGLQDLNHYIRWPSDWTTIINNLDYLIKNGHKCAINTTVSIYNVAKLDQLFSWLDSRFPNILIHIGFAEYPHAVSPWSYPDKQRVIDSMEKIKTLSCYSNDQLFASSVDGILRHFKRSTQSINNLKSFFDFNDKLDQQRSIRLADYLPELAAYRSNVFDSNLQNC